MNIKSPLASKISRVCLSIVALIGIFIFTVFTINQSLFDEELKPEVEALLKPIAMPPVESNAYYALMGFSAAEGKDMVKAGAALIERYRQNRDRDGKDQLTPEDYEEILGGKDLDYDWQERYDNCQSRIEYGCAGTIKTQIQAQPLNDPRLQLMLARYEQILQMPQFQEIDHMTFATPLPSFGIPLELNRLKLASLDLADDKAGFLAHLKADMAFWKRVLEQGDTVIAKMVAVAALWNDLQFLSEFLAAQPISDAETTSITPLVKPLTKAQLDIGQTFPFEQRALKPALQNLSAEELGDSYGIAGWPLAFMVQPNATMNRYYAQLTDPMISLAKLPRSGFIQAMATGKTPDGDLCCFLNEEHGVSLSPSSLYNLGGKLLLSAVLYRAEDYIARVHDLNGMTHLLRTQLNIKTHAEQDVQSLIADANQSPESPELSLKTDSDGQWLQFDCLDKRSFCRIKL